ncbi:MAG: SUMF1/EgtB/PvdO family nonheme iron enzyme [Planctomycetota bacterium]
MTRSLRPAWLAILLAPTFAIAQRAPQVRELRVLDEPPDRVQFTVRWSNAWRDVRNHDGAWIILRGEDATAGPLRLAESGHRCTGKVAGAVAVSEDRCGVFVALAEEHRGDVEWTIELALAASAPESVSAWTVGMVFIPAGAFELGDDHPDVLNRGAFHQLDENGAVAGTLRVADESELQVEKSPGALWYQRDRAGYHGDQGGPIPADWPKGTKAFWIMKHELTQGEYAAFLTALPEPWRTLRSPIGTKGEESSTCSLALDGERVVAASPLRPCNFVSWDDTCAWMDWMALRPMTEFEFEKAARGPVRPIAGDYPWGTASREKLERQVQRTRDLTLATAADEAELSDEHRERFGASYYRVMDLSGSVWERVVTVGHPRGRAFVGSHGDGVLTEDARATNSDWPATDTSGQNAHGIGFRGGAEYFKPTSPNDPTNPQSRVATRTYGGWAGAGRYKTYSARAVRTSR